MITSVFVEVAPGATALVVIVNDAVVCPARTVTVAGTDATVGLLLARATTASPVGAGPVSVTLPVAEAPPTTLVGVTVMLEIAAWVTWIVVVRVAPPG